MPLKKVGTLQEDKEQVKSSKLKLISSGKKEEKQDSFMDKASVALDEYGRIGMRGANTMAFGLPGYIANKVDPTFIERNLREPESDLGQGLDLATQLGALIGGGAAGLSKMVGNVVVPKVASNIGLKNIPGQIARFRAAELGRSVLRGGVEGGVFGGVQLFGDEIDPEQQAIQSAGGAVVGAAFPLAGAVLKSGVNTYKAFKSTPKRSALTRLSESVSDVNRTSKIKIDIIKNQAKKEIESTTNTLKDNITTLEGKLLQGSKEGVESIQNELRGFSRASSDAFGKQVDDISNKYIREGKTVTKSEFNDFLNKVTKDLDDDDLLNDDVLAGIKMMRNKYGIKFIGEGSKFRRASTGEAIGGAIRSNKNDVIPFEQLSSEVRNINNLFSSQLKTTGQFGKPDIQVSILRKNFGDLLGPEYAQLNKEYGKTAEALKVAYRIFKPIKGEFGSTQGVNQLKNIGLGKSGIGEESVINFLQKGTRIGGTEIKGLTNVTGGLKSIGSDISKNKELITLTRKSIEKMRDSQVESLKKELTKKLSHLSDHKSILQDIEAGKQLTRETLIKVRNIAGGSLILFGLLSALKNLNK